MFDSNGDLIGENDDGSAPDVGNDPTTGTTYDTFLQLTLASGDYIVAISQFDNFFNGDVGDNISQGFIREGQPNFTATYGCSAGQFCDFTGDSRTNEWAFDILDVDDAAAVPEPLTMLGAGTALGFGTFFKRKLAKKQNKNN